MAPNESDVLRIRHSVCIFIDLSVFCFACERTCLTHLATPFTKFPMSKMLTTLYSDDVAC
jgi:hypothetical protein